MKTLCLIKCTDILWRSPITNAQCAIIQLLVLFSQAVIDRLPATTKLMLKQLFHMGSVLFFSFRASVLLMGDVKLKNVFKNSTVF